MYPQSTDSENVIRSDGKPAPGEPPTEPPPDREPEGPFEKPPADSPPDRHRAAAVPPP